MNTDTRPQAALCVDETTLQNPSMIGLPDENVLAQPWLKVFTSAEKARQELHYLHDVQEVWVISDEVISPINLAATIKRDNPKRVVGLLSRQETGSFRSRFSHTAVDCLLTQEAFVSRYCWFKDQHRALQSIYEEPIAPDGTKRLRGQAVSGSLSDDLSNKAVDDKCVSAKQKDERRLTSSEYCNDKESRVHVKVFESNQDSQDTRVRGEGAFVLPVFSGSGGVGKSVVSVLSAYLSQGLGYETLLIDCDWQFGDLSTLVGLKNPLRLDEVYAAPSKLAQLKSDNLTPAFLAAPAKAEDSELLAAGLSSLLQRVSNQFDVVVCNTGSFWAEQHAVLLESSSKAFFLIDQRTTSLSSCRHALELCSRCGIALGPVLMLLNRCGKQAPFSAFDVAGVLEGFSVRELLDGGSDVEDLMGAGFPLDLLASKNPLCLSIEEVLLDIIPGARDKSDQTTSRSRGKLFGLLRGEGKSSRKHKERRGVACL